MQETNVYQCVFASLCLGWTGWWWCKFYFSKSGRSCIWPNSYPQIRLQSGSHLREKRKLLHF